MEEEEEGSGSTKFPVSLEAGDSLVFPLPRDLRDSMVSGDFPGGLLFLPPRCLLVGVEDSKGVPLLFPPTVRFAPSSVFSFFKKLVSAWWAAMINTFPSFLICSPENRFVKVCLEIGQQALLASGRTRSRKIRGVFTSKIQPQRRVCLRAGVSAGKGIFGAAQAKEKKKLRDEKVVEKTNQMRKAPVPLIPLTFFWATL